MPSGWMKNADREVSNAKERAGNSTVHDQWSGETSQHAWQVVEKKTSRYLGNTPEPHSLVLVNPTKKKKRRARRKIKTTQDMDDPDNSLFQNLKENDLVATETTCVEAQCVTLKNLCGDTSITPASTSTTTTKDEDDKDDNGGDGGSKTITTLSFKPIVWPQVVDRLSKVRVVQAVVYHDPHNAEGVRRFDNTFSTKGKIILIKCNPSVPPILQLKRCQDANAIGCIFIETPTTNNCEGPHSPQDLIVRNPNFIVASVANNAAVLLNSSEERPLMVTLCFGKRKVSGPQQSSATPTPTSTPTPTIDTASNPHPLVSGQRNRAAGEDVRHDTHDINSDTSGMNVAPSNNTTAISTPAHGESRERDKWNINSRVNGVTSFAAMVAKPRALFAYNITTTNNNNNSNNNNNNNNNTTTTTTTTNNNNDDNTTTITTIDNQRDYNSLLADDSINNNIHVWDHDDDDGLEFSTFVSTTHWNGIHVQENDSNGEVDWVDVIKSTTDEIEAIESGTTESVRVQNESATQHPHRDVEEAGWETVPNDMVKINNGDDNDDVDDDNNDGDDDNDDDDDDDTDDDDDFEMIDLKSLD